MFDLVSAKSAYIFGFMQADGHHSAGSRQRGKVSIEIKASDDSLLHEIKAALPWPSTVTYRSRATNFAAHYDSAVLTMCSLEGRTRLLELGLPVGKKSRTIAPPHEPFSHRDYLRGLIDADGSVGFTGNGLPFVSMVSASPAIGDFVCREILAVTGARRTARPNSRDGVANVMVANDTAALLASWLYTDAAIALERKRSMAAQVAAWRRPANMRARSFQRPWNPEEDAVALQFSVREAAERLGRTEKSVNIRRWRLRKLAAEGAAAA